MKTRPKLLFIYGDLPPPMKRDLEILKIRYDVDPIPRDFGLRNIFSLFRMIKKLVRTDMVYLRFVNKQNLFVLRIAKILGKKTFLVGGGYDSVGMPEINYGMLITKKGKKMVRKAYGLADLIIAFSDSSTSSIKKVQPKANVKTVYVGSIDVKKYKPHGNKKNTVLTVGHIKWKNLKRKGLETFVRSAAYVPGADFVLVGGFRDDSIDHLKKISPSNVIFPGYLSEDEKIKYMQEAKVYVQVSAHEGFGITLAEAMSCGCIPVVTKRYAIPEVVGDTGYYVPFGDAKVTALAISKALEDDVKLSRLARKRVVQNFNRSRRERELLEVVEKIRVS